MRLPEKFIELHWPLSRVTLGEIIQERDERITGRLSAREGEFVYKIADPSKTEEAIDRDTYIFDFLSSRGFQHVPPLLKTKRDTPYSEVEGRYAYIMEYAGKQAAPTPATWAVLGSITAQLHSIQGYPYKSLFSFESAKRMFPQKAAQLPFGKEYMELVETLPDFDTLSQSIIHTDIGHHNAVEGDDGKLVLIDWDDAGICSTILDLGAPLICHFLHEDEYFLKAEAEIFYRTYFSEKEIPDDEKEYLFDAGLFFALMYAPFGDIQKNWKKILFALERKDLFQSIIG
jgi:Ser/Thr protein kinase RdoA (MazF antagonist)